MRDNLACKRSRPYAIDPKVQLHATGRRGDGGILEIFFNGKLVADVSLSPTEFAILALLIEAARRSLGKHWATACVSATNLARELVRLQLGTGDRQCLYQALYKLRKLLRKELKLAEKLQDAKWGQIQIELQPGLGYRLSVAPNRLKITLLDQDGGGH